MLCVLLYGCVLFVVSLCFILHDACRFCMCDSFALYVLLFHVSVFIKCISFIFQDSFDFIRFFVCIRSVLKQQINLCQYLCLDRWRPWGTLLRLGQPWTFVTLVNDPRVPKRSQSAKAISVALFEQPKTTKAIHEAILECQSIF